MLTLGKDMILRDYSQGAYRMRGIETGQSITVLIIPQVATLIRHALYPRLKDEDTARYNQGHTNDNPHISDLPGNEVNEGEQLNDGELAVCTETLDGNVRVLQEVVAWLVLNMALKEHLQYNLLQLQDCDANFRRFAVDRILSENGGYADATDKAAVCEAAAIFKEKVVLDVLATLKTPSGATSFVDILTERWKEMEEIFTKVDDMDVSAQRQAPDVKLERGDTGLLARITKKIEGFKDDQQKDMEASAENQKEQEQEQEQEQEMHGRMCKHKRSNGT